MQRRLPFTWLAMIAVLCANGRVLADAKVDFQRQIAPILEQHCLRCHSPAKSEGEISLATIKDLRELEYVVAGDPTASHLLQLVRAVDAQPARMPKEGDPLSDNQVALIRRWIAEGAEWPETIVLQERSKADSTWWSLQPLAKVQPPSAEDMPTAWRENPIDRFVYAKLAERGLTGNPRADRRTLIRRATYDLTGLPPSPKQVQEFVGDTDANAYERLVDRLLESPHYGERWGRHWLDVVRFGESNGYERNFIINDLWPFRDYVIRSFNDDKPFDQFIREHLAGDVFGQDQPEVEVGSAFLVAGPYDDVGNQDAVQAAQIRANTIDEIIRTTGEAFLGLTIGCARCHDHKFDPILQRDYYGWYATFAGVQHGSRVVATASEKTAHDARLKPLEQRRETLTEQRKALTDAIVARAEKRQAEYEKRWIRGSANPSGNEEVFAPVNAKFIRLVSEGIANSPENDQRIDIDEIDVWSTEDPPRNVALAASGAVASGAARQIEDFPGAYGPHLTIDGKAGERFLGTAGSLTIGLPKRTRIDRVFFSTARGEERPDQPQFAALAEYRIEISDDGDEWIEVANSHDRRPVNEAHRTHRLRNLEVTADEAKQLAELDRERSTVDQQIADLPKLPTMWLGTRDAAGVEGPFHIFVGGSPQRKGDAVSPASLGALASFAPRYELEPNEAENDRRRALADWIVHAENPLTPRVLANRLWHYHFGTGILDTPSDFGYMGGKPTHPRLLDWLANQLHECQWRLKPLHKRIMMSETYRQAGDYRSRGAQIDGNARLLWRFPPRRLSAEEIRDTILSAAGKLNTEMGGPGFRLYRFLQDNVATYEPLDQLGSETYRRAVYHQNARASVLDLMTDFDQPDCAFSTPKRAETTTPLQALTMLNHSFTLDMARFTAERLQQEAGSEPIDQIERAFQICYSRQPTGEEVRACLELIEGEGLPALCRVLLNTSELIYVR